MVFFSFPPNKTKIMAACQFQSSYYPKYERNRNGSYTSNEDCTDPEFTLKGLTDTERNKQTERYKRDQRTYLALQQPMGAHAICGQELGTGDAVTQCAYVETLERKGAQRGVPELRDGYWQKTGAGDKIMYSTYGKANAAFERIHLREGNNETGYLKVNNPPNMFRGAGRYHDQYTTATETTVRREYIDNTHDERKCAMGIETFCKATRNPTVEEPNNHQFDSEFYDGRSTDEMAQVTQQALERTQTPGTATVGMNSQYNATRGYTQG